ELAVVRPRPEHRVAQVLAVDRRHLALALALLAAIEQLAGDRQEALLPRGEVQRERLAVARVVDGDIRQRGGRPVETAPLARARARQPRLRLLAKHLGWWLEIVDRFALLVLVRKAQERI